MAETAVTAPSAASAAPAVRLASVWLTTLALGEDGEQSGQDVVPAEPSGSWAFLTAQSAMLLAILFGEPFRPAQASAIGQALVRANFVAADVLGRSLRVLMLRLPEMLTDYLACPARELERRVAEVSGALANGYVHALRDRTSPSRNPSCGPSSTRSEASATAHARGDARPADRPAQPGSDLRQALRRARRRPRRQRGRLLRGPRRLQGGQRPLRSPGRRRTARHGVQAHLRDRHRLRRPRRPHRRRRVHRRGGGISWRQADDHAGQGHPRRGEPPGRAAHRTGLQSPPARASPSARGHLPRQRPWWPTRTPPFTVPSPAGPAGGRSPGIRADVAGLHAG